MFAPRRRGTAARLVSLCPCGEEALLPAGGGTGGRAGDRESGYRK